MRHADFRTTEKYYLCDTIQEDAGRIREILSTVTQSVTQNRTHFIASLLISAGFEPAILGSEERRSSADRVQTGFPSGKQPHRLAADGAQIAV